MEKEFVPYELALRMKQLGFDEPCFGYRDSVGYLMIQKTPHCVISAPTFSQAFRWFREKYELYSFVFKFDEGFGYETYKEGVTQTNESFDTYEEAELACLKKLIEIVKQK
jgi:hypothetical protein